MGLRHKFSPPPAIPDDTAQLRAAQRESTDALIGIIHQGPEARRVSSEMARMRVKNGYEDLIESALRLRKEDR